jgi:hypothetical protein
MISLLNEIYKYVLAAQHKPGALPAKGTWKWQ